MTINAARHAALTLESGARVVATYHPSAVLRAPEDAGRDELYRTLVADLKRAGAMATLAPQR
jgi:uracil-DNA glycosylase